MTSMAHPRERALPASQSDRGLLDVRDVHTKHADFVWRSLQRLGVPRADLEDALQEVFVVVHRQIHAFDGNAKITSWLFAICLRIASNWRRLARFRYEAPLCDAPEAVDTHASPLEQLERSRAKQTLVQLLDCLEPERRAIVVMFEIEGASCEEIAEVMGIAVGTVHSRLHRARTELREALLRKRSRESERRLA